MQMLCSTVCGKVETTRNSKAADSNPQ